MKIGVMRGRLREFDLAQVLQVVGIGRQYTGVEVSNDVTVLGTIFVKSGKIVQVETSDARGLDAFFKLFGETDGQFFVYRTDTPAALPEPLGAVDGLLVEAMNRKSVIPESGPRAAAPPEYPEGE